MVRRTVANEVLIDNIDRFLKEGREVVFLVKGYSMLPFITGWAESVEVHRLEHAPRPGDIVLAKVETGHFVLHRIISVDADAHVTLMGDGNYRGVERCKAEDIVGIALYAVDYKERKRYLYTPWRKFASRVWWKLLPLRRYILAVYRRTIMKWTLHKAGVKTKGWKVVETI
ncbi:MAG: S24/S26 family peptidase [Bacteroidaceae bacterium]|nr:S24/S26 family peptidase [Bacteroidaceae bacterium]